MFSASSSAGWGQGTASGAGTTMRPGAAGVPSTPGPSGGVTSWSNTITPPTHALQPPQGTPGMTPSHPTFGSSLGHTSTPGGLLPQNAASSPAPAAWNGAPSTHSPIHQAPVAMIPGYLSRMRGAGDRAGGGTHRRTSMELSSPLAKNEPDTSLLATKEKTPHRSAASVSPTHGFHSSFFARSHADQAGLRSSVPAANAGRESSIFGAGGLRGSVSPQDDADRSVTRAPRSPSMPATAALGEFDAHASSEAPMDDDDAPPAAALCDTAPDASARAPWPSSATQPRAPGVALAMSAAGATSTAREAPLSQRTVLVYGFPPALHGMVLDQFKALGGLVHAEDVPLSTKGTAAASLGMASPLRLTYSEPAYALHAVRQTGQLFAGVCLLGVRWAADDVHHDSLARGVDAPVFQADGPKRAGADRVPGKTPETPATSKVAPTSTPAFGRPVSTVDSPVAVLAPSSAKPSATASPFRAMVQAGESLLRGPHDASAGQPAAQDGVPASTTVLGRLADGLFGW